MATPSHGGRAHAAERGLGVPAAPPGALRHDPVVPRSRRAHFKPDRYTVGSREPVGQAECRLAGGGRRREHHGPAGLDLGGAVVNVMGAVEVVCANGAVSG